MSDWAQKIGLNARFRRFQEPFCRGRTRWAGATGPLAKEDTGNGVRSYLDKLLASPITRYVPLRSSWLVSLRHRGLAPDLIVA